MSGLWPVNIKDDFNSRKSQVSDDSDNKWLRVLIYIYHFRQDNVLLKMTKQENVYGLVLNEISTSKS